MGTLLLRKIISVLLPFIRTSNGNSSHGLVNLDDRSVELRLLDASTVLVGPRGPVEQTGHGSVNLGQGISLASQFY